MTRSWASAFINVTGLGVLFGVRVEGESLIAEPERQYRDAQYRIPLAALQVRDDGTYGCAITDVTPIVVTELALDAIGALVAGLEPNHSEDPLHGPTCPFCGAHYLTATEQRLVVSCSMCLGQAAHAVMLDHWVGQRLHIIRETVDLDALNWLEARLAPSYWQFEFRRTRRAEAFKAKAAV